MDEPSSGTHLEPIGSAGQFLRRRPPSILSVFPHPANPLLTDMDPQPDTGQYTQQLEEQREILELKIQMAEPDVRRGKAHAAGSRAGGAERKAAEAEKWQVWRKDAAELRLKNPKATKRSLARMIANRHLDDGYSGTVETIRKKL